MSSLPSTSAMHALFGSRRNEGEWSDGSGSNTQILALAAPRIRSDGKGVRSWWQTASQTTWPRFWTIGRASWLSREYS
jgi:hypothetical protein